MDQNRIPSDISADVARDSFLSAFYTLEELTAMGAGLHAMSHGSRVERNVCEQHLRELSATPEARSIVNKEIQWREDKQAEHAQDKQLSMRHWEIGL